MNRGNQRNGIILHSFWLIVTFGYKEKACPYEYMYELIQGFIQLS